MSDNEAAFVESTDEPIVRGKKLSLPLTEDGSIDWDSASDKHKKLFIQAIKSDPNGILQNIQEEATDAPAGSGIADATVVALTNVLFVVEAIGITTLGPKAAPVLANLHPVVAIKACTVTEEEMKPVMPAAKRIIADLLPPEYLEYQDWAIVGEHLVKLSAAKFKACIDLAMEIEQRKQNPSYNKVNGSGVVIDAEPTS
jgi:hypothetical protein